MDVDNPFDKKLEAQKGSIPEDVVRAAVFVTDTLDLCWASAQAVFKEQATPDLAIEIYRLMAERMEVEADLSDS